MFVLSSLSEALPTGPDRGPGAGHHRWSRLSARRGPGGLAGRQVRTARARGGTGRAGRGHVGGASEQGDGRKFRWRPCVPIPWITPWVSTARLIGELTHEFDDIAV